MKDKTTPDSDLYSQIIVEVKNYDLSKIKKSSLIQVRLYWTIGGLISNYFEKETLSKKARITLLYHLAKQLKSSIEWNISKGEFTFMAQLYESFPDLENNHIELSLTHFRHLVRLPNKTIRTFYAQQAQNFQWTVKQLIRQIKSKSFERNFALTKENDSHALPLKTPYLLEFIKPGNEIKESELESALLTQIHHFLFELGNGFAFVARQQMITTPSGKQFFIDLVFYHFLLKCFILIDLKIGALTHRDLGQMDMYVRLFDAKFRKDEDRPTLGIILCTEKDDAFEEYSLLKDNPQVFALPYKFNIEQ